MLSVATITYFFYQRVETVCFDEHVYAYLVRDTDDKLKITSVSQLKDHHPLAKHFISGSKMNENWCYIATRYKIV